MTVSTTSNKVTRDGDGTILSFQYDFKIFADGDLDVYIRDTNGTETLQVINTNYTVTGAGNAHRVHAIRQVTLTNMYPYA